MLVSPSLHASHDGRAPLGSPAGSRHGARSFAVHQERHSPAERPAHRGTWRYLTYYEEEEDHYEHEKKGADHDASQHKNTTSRSAPAGHGGGGGGGNKRRFLTVALAGLTAVLFIPLIPDSAVAGDTGDCGAASANAVTCSDATYTNTAGSPIKYGDRTGGLSLTVQPSGASTVTITSTKLPATTSEAFPGIHLDGHGTLKVLLDGAVKVVNGATRTTVEATYEGKTQTFIHPDHKRGSQNDGVYVAYDKDSDRGKTKGMVEVMVGKDAMIGSATAPAGRYGVHAAFLETNGGRNYPAGDIKVTNAGEVHGHFVGIYAKHDGAGAIEIETSEGSVTSMGIQAISNKANRNDRGGDVAIRHHGRIVVKNPARYADSITTGVATPVEMDKINFADRQRGGIYVEHWEKRAGTRAMPSSSILVESSGDIVAHPNGSYARSAIYIITRGRKGTVVPITVDVTGGTITADDQSGNGGNGVYMYVTGHDGGLIKVDFAGAVARTGSERDGIHINRLGADDNSGAVDVNRDIEVTLKSGARIGMEGDEPTVGKHGVWIRQRPSGGTIKVTVSEGARIGTVGTPVGGNGVFAEATTYDSENDILITNEGFIHAKDSGVFAWHQGRGDMAVKHLKGEIVAGDLPDSLKEIVEDYPTKLADLKPRTAGILAFHGGSVPKPLAGETFDEGDPSTYTAEIGKIEITSKGDVTSKGDGILAYVKDLDDTDDAEAAIAKMIIPIMIDVSGGVIAADGHGVHAETATAYEDEDAPKAGKISVTVGEMATIRAKEDGVYVKGKRTFASDHARAGQYDQTVTINGKVTGGGGDHAGVRMVKGGTLVVGTGGPEARISAASGVAVHADGPLTITMSKTADGRIGWVMGKIQNGDSDETTFAGVEVGETYRLPDREETKGVYDSTIERKVTLREYADEDYHEFELVSQEEIVREYHDRARVYEALPSVLLDLTEQASYQERMAAPRDGNGVWARVAARDAARRPASATTAQGFRGRALAWDVTRYGLEAGVDFRPGVSKRLLLGLSLHARQGEATVAHGGTIDVSGFGGGGSATYRDPAGRYLDGRFSYTYFDDVDLTSRTRGAVQSDLSGHGYALGLEAGQRLALAGLDRVALTPRVRLVWSTVDLEDFADLAGLPGSGRVALETATSFKGRFGVLAETAVGAATLDDWAGDGGRLFGSLDVEQEFLVDRKVQASGAALASEVRATWMRVGFGGAVSWNAGLTTLSGEGFYATAGFGNTDFGGSLTLSLRF